MAVSKAILQRRINGLYSTINRMNNASNKAGILAANIEKMKTTFGNNIKIDDNVPYLDNIDTVVANAKGVQSSLSGKIVPSLYYRINELKKELNNS